MPLVKIELAKGNSKEFLLNFMNTVMDTVADVLKLPTNDRNIRLMEYDADLFTMKPPYNYIIEISLFKGRTAETKSQLYSLLANNLANKTGVEKSEIFVLLNDQPKINWGVRGGIPATDVNLDFEVKI